MAERDERVTPATRNYVVFGLLLVVALALAIRDWLDPHERRGQADSAVRLLIVSDDPELPLAALVDVDGFAVTRVSPATAIAEGLELLDRRDGDSTALHLAAIAYADQLGFGFVALDRATLAEPGSSSPAHAPDWELPEDPPRSARFAVFSVGDVAIEGPRMHAVGLTETVEFDPRLAALDSLRLGLYQHPDLARLWWDDTNASETQARQLLASRGLDDRRELLMRDHAIWADVDAAWPSSPGGLARAWERVQVAPIHGGVLVEVRRGRPHVSFARELALVYAETTTLEFVPTDALARGSTLEAVDRREPCENLATPIGEVAVAPDGAAVVVRGPQTAVLYTFDADQAQCRAHRIRELALGDAPIGRPSVDGTAWATDGDWLRWWDAGGEHRLRVAGLGASSGPWWVGDGVLAMLGERELGGVEGELEGGFEPVVVLIAQPDRDRDPVRIELGAYELRLDQPGDEPLIDLRPAGPRELVVVTERCAEAAGEPDGACLHRVRASVPFDQLVPEAITLQTLGAITPHVELAIAADGSRVAWIERETGRLLVADLHGVTAGDTLVAVPLELDGAVASSLRISADGRIVVVEVATDVIVAERVVATVAVPRVFTLAPAPVPVPLPDDAG